MSSLPNPVAPVSTARSVGVKQGRGIVKLVLSGDAIIIRGQPKGGPPPEKQINLSNVLAPKLARRSNPNYPDSVQTGDEAFAWESRENLRRKITGREVFFVVDYAPNNDRCYGTVYLGTSENGENMTEMQVKEGMVEVRKVNVRSDNTEHSRLIELEDQAKSEGKGKWVEPKPESAIRDVKWTLDNPRNFVDSFHAKPVPAVIEHVRDGCTMRALLPSSHHQITFMLSGIKCPMIRRDPDDPKKEVAEPFAAEAKFYVESRLLQRDVKITLEGVSNQNILLATVHHPNGNISEMLLKEGFARCVDWSITSYSQGPENLRALEKQAKEKKIRIWKDWVSKKTELNITEREFTGKVIQVVNADAIAVKTADGGVRTIHLSSVRPPRYDDVTFKKEKDPAPPSEGAKGKSRPLYDVPYMFEAREFMRKKLIGKKVNVKIDYIKPSSVATESLGAFPERTCATVTSGGINIAEALVSKGLVKVVRHRQDDDQRSSHYDDLLAAEQRAIKTGKGVNCKKEPPIHRVAEISSDVTKAKQFLPFLQRAGRSEAVVEYVFGGSRLKLYIPKETCLITFLLAGIDCPRGARNGAGGLMEADPFADQALAFTKDQCMHREVMVEVETIDRVGNFIGWVFVDGKNISQLLLENGLSKIHFTAERSNYYKILLDAEEKAKSTRLKIWEDFVEAKETEEVVVEEATERKTNFRKVCITEVTPQLHFYYQQADGGSKLEALMEQLRSTLQSDPPLPGSYKARRGDFCVAIFSADGLWYRARIEKVAGDNVHVHFIDFGNKEIVQAGRVSSLPAEFNTHVLLPQAQECALALVNPPSDEDSLVDAFQALCRNLECPSYLLNTEYKDNGLDYVSLLNPDDKTDIGKSLVTTGHCTVIKRREKRLAGMVSDYIKDQENAKKQHLNLWRYGDITDDDASEFGYKKN